MRDMPRESLASSIKTLADDLYSRDTHFIFELIQNAEDNDYMSDIRPRLRFELRQEELEEHQNTVLIVHNNERGFQEKHVRALCQVGRSTKNKSQGYIGEKGIGFKSVFRITTCPYVFSNGFQFCLPEDDETTGLGYIVPSWVTCPPAWIKRDETTVIMPINKNKIDIQNVIEALRDFAPETILFLQNLSSIEISVHLPEYNTEYEVIIEKHVKSSIGPSKLIELSYLRRETLSGEETFYSFQYWLTEIEFEKPDDVQHEKRRDIEFRKVSVAIPLEQTIQEGKLFAYLPVWEKTGLPFIVNADFLLVSSREGVKEDEGWNKWLRGCIVETYAKSFHALMDAPEIPFEAKISAYASIPFESHYPFLSYIIKPIQECLASKDCVLVLPDNSLVQPTKARLSAEDFRAVLGSPEDFPDYIRGETRLVCPEIELFAKQLTTIGVKPLSSLEVVSCLEDSVWVRQHSVTWFVDLFRYLSTNKFKPATLYILPIIPVSDDVMKIRLSCDKEQPIYFPLDETEQDTLNHVPVWLSKLVPIAFLHSELKHVLDQQNDHEVLNKWLTEVLCVYDLSIENYCVDILAKLTITYEQLDEDQIIKAAKWLEAHAGPKIEWGDLPIILSDGRKILLKDARKLPIQDIVVPENYNPKAGWQHIWPLKEDRSHFVALANAYPSLTQEWVTKLNIKVYPAFQKIKYKYYEVPTELSSEKELASTCVTHAAYSRTYDTEISTYVQPSSLIQPNEEGKVSKTLSQALISYLSLLDIPDPSYYKNKQKLYELGFFAKGTYQNHGTGTIYLSSSVLEQLRKLSWFPTTKGYVRPSQAFLFTQGVKEILGNTVPYFKGVLTENVLEFLGVRSEVTVKELLGLLQDTAGDTTADPDMAERVYSELSVRIARDPQDIQTLFINEALILKKGDQKGVMWFKSGECVWEDAYDILGDDFAYLQNQYPKLKEFFVEQLGIKEQVDTECFARQWLKLQDAPLENLTQQVMIVERLYKKLKPIAQTPEDERPDWCKGFSENIMLYTQSDTFCTSDKMVVPDDGELRHIFENCANVEFAWRPRKDAFNEWLPFYKALNVPLLSESVTEDLDNCGDYELLDSKRYITQAAVKMIAAWLRERTPEDYARLSKENVFSKLLSLSEAITMNEIKVEFVLETEAIYESKTVAHPVFWDRIHNILIYQDELKVSQLAKMLAKSLIVKYKDLEDWVELVLEASDIERLKDKNWSVPQEILDLCKTELRVPLESQNSLVQTDNKKAEQQTETVSGITGEHQPKAESNAVPIGSIAGSPRAAAVPPKSRTDLPPLLRTH